MGGESSRIPLRLPCKPPSLFRRPPTELLPSGPNGLVGPTSPLVSKRFASKALPSVVDFPPLELMLDFGGGGCVRIGIPPWCAGRIGGRRRCSVRG